MKKRTPFNLPGILLAIGFSLFPVLAGAQTKQPEIKDAANAISQQQAGNPLGKSLTGNHSSLAPAQPSPVGKGVAVDGNMKSLQGKTPSGGTTPKLQQTAVKGNPLGSKGNLQNIGDANQKAHEEHMKKQQKQFKRVSEIMKKYNDTHKSIINNMK